MARRGDYGEEEEDVDEEDDEESSRWREEKRWREGKEEGQQEKDEWEEEETWTARTGGHEEGKEVSLVFANVSESDILLRKKLDRLSFSHTNVKVYYVIDRPAKGWDRGVGYINEDMLRKAMPPPSDENLIMLSGLLAKMGYTKNQVFKF
ncbi:hypothetical protein CBR_g46196 [Chara braunii]|uniref:Oxidoreductase FAD/NAD(P)-binding domain-containing protein n=1 Tax=Chara braunii TaxID=69332 RepID=A0A388M019_CHABU|nr:hypothetical protein CBR_g46196 [Chara braunii]|eukprot:GBG87896.1 hypothetical protein CBR_g46196 [Chara braunii]